MIIFLIVMFYIFLVLIIDYLIDNKTSYNLVFIIFISTIGILSINKLFSYINYIFSIIFLLLFRYLFSLYYSEKTYIIKDRKFNFNFKNNKYTYNKLIKDLKRNKIKDIDKVSNAYIKNNNLYIYDRPIIFIKDGIVDYNTLRSIGKDSIWLSYYISKNKLKLEDIRLAFYKGNTSYFVKNI